MTSTEYTTWLRSKTKPTPSMRAVRAAWERNARIACDMAMFEAKHGRATAECIVRNKKGAGCYDA